MIASTRRVRFYCLNMSIPLFHFFFYRKLHEVTSYCLSTFTTRDGTADHDFESYLSSSFTASEQEEMR